MAEHEDGQEVTISPNGVQWCTDANVLITEEALIVSLLQAQPVLSPNARVSHSMLRSIAQVAVTPDRIEQMMSVLIAAFATWTSQHRPEGGIERLKRRVAEAVDEGADRASSDASETDGSDGTP